MIRLEYTMNTNETLLTPCPFDDGDIKIGSMACNLCDKFIAENEKIKVVICGNEALMRCPVCGSHYQNQTDFNDCIEKCTCDHEWVYNVYSCDMDEGMNIERKCSKCRKFEETEFSVSNISQASLAQLWTT